MLDREPNTSILTNFEIQIISHYFSDYETVFAHGVKLNNLKKKIQQGLGTQKADIVLRGGKVFDLITGDFLEGDVAITGDTIVGTCASYDAKGHRCKESVSSSWFH